MADGGRDAGFWVLLVIALVTAVCAAYTLLAVTGVFGNAPTGRELRETTQPDSVASPTPEEARAERNSEPEEPNLALIDA